MIGLKTSRQQLMGNLVRSAIFKPSLIPFRTLSTPPNPPQPSPINNHPILRRIPKFLQPFTTRFINAPILHVTSFLILHELTAVVPLVGLWYVFHQNPGYIPNLDFAALGLDKITEMLDKSMAKFDFSDYSLNEKANFIIEGAYAYIVVKTLAPIRIFVSLSLMPFFSRWFVVPFNKGIKSIFSRKPAKKPETETSGIKKVTKPRL